MATAVSPKKKCTFWDKCYRKNKKHLDEFLHPGDKDDEESSSSKTSKTSKKNDTSPDNDAPTKPRLLHNISVADDDDEMPAWKTGKGPRKRKSSADNDDDDDDESNDNSKPGPSTAPKAPTPKKVKFDDKNIEKITVDYSKPKTSKAANSDQPTNSKVDDKPTTSKTTKTIEYKAKREKCKYWDKCYQSNEKHLKEFYHPDDDVPSDDEDDKKKTRGKNKGPVNAFDDGVTVKFDTGFVLKREGDVYSCTCPGFTNQKASEKERTCKHLGEYLGEEFEKDRVGSSPTRKQPIASHINISLLLAHKYDEKSHNPVGWWISEKLDGVRAFWNGRCFYSRLGNAFYAPEWFTKDLPKDIHLDGELFGGRGEFQSTVSVVKTPESPRWKNIKYHVFDGPHMGKDLFEKRMKTIKEYFEDVQPQYALFVDQTKCISKEQLDQMLTRILNLGGEGLMIRQPGSIYEATRSKTLLKIKKFYDAENLLTSVTAVATKLDDKYMSPEGQPGVQFLKEIQFLDPTRLVTLDAIVIAHERGKGVNQNRCGALRCRMACGKEFSVGSGLTDKQRGNPPKIGSIITYKFQELSKGGSPRFPTFLGIRIDMTEPKDAEIRAVLGEDEA